MSNISARAAVLYLRNFQPCNPETRARYDAVLASEDDVPNPEDAATLAHAEKAFSDIYTDRFGRRRFVVPTTLLLLLSAFLLSIPMAEVERVRRQREWQLTDGSLPLRAVAGPAVATGAIPLKAPANDWGWVIAFAILGGYIRVIYELVLRYYQDNIRPADLFWWCYRLIVSVPLGYAVAVLLDGGESTRAAYAAAFLLGLFPTSTVTNMGRKLFANWTQSTESATEGQSQLKEIPALDPATTLILIDEDITTYTQLAYADPIRLCIRTGLGFSFIISCVSEGLLAVYLTTKMRMEAARRFGIAGGYEAVTLWDEANDDEDENLKTRAETIIKELAPKIDCTEVGLRNTLNEIADDPYIQFVRECWASNVA